MSVDESIIQQVWNGSIPCIFQIYTERSTSTSNQQHDNNNVASTNTATTEIPSDLKLMVSRQSYLPSLNHILVDHFNINIIQTNNSTDTVDNNHHDIIYYYQHIPLHCAFTVGVLYDLLSYQNYEDQQTAGTMQNENVNEDNTQNDTHNDGNNESQYNQPFTISVRFVTKHNESNVNYDPVLSSTPPASSMIYASPSLLRSHVLNTIKQCIYMRYDKCMMNSILSASEYQEFWLSIDTTHYTTYHTYIHHIYLQHGDTQYIDHSNTWKSCTVRIMCGDRQIIRNVDMNDTSNSIDMDELYTYIQRPINEITDDHMTTLMDVLYTLLPSIMMPARADNDASSYQLHPSILCCIQGITDIPLNTSIKWLCQHMASTDQFLYIILIKR